VRGLEVDTIEQPYRRLLDVLRKVRQQRPQVALICEQYVGQTAERIAAEVSNANEDAVIIRINEIEFEEALLLARLELDEVLAEWDVVDAPSDPAPAFPQPADGEERYYCKLHGSGIGDIMRQVDDCGHDQWDSTNKAPRAWKGIEHMEGVTPQMLFRCKPLQA